MFSRKIVISGNGAIEIRRNLVESVVERLVSIASGMFGKDFSLFNDVTRISRRESWRNGLFVEWKRPALFRLLVQAVQYAESRSCKAYDGNNIAVIKPKPDCCINLPFRYSQFVKGNFKWTHSKLGALFRLWQSVTQIKKRWNRSKRSQSPTATKAKTCSNPKTSSASYARPKSGLSTSHLHRSHFASNRSSSPEKLASLRLARSAFFSVSVTKYPFLPCGFLPAPSRLPPHFNLFFM